MTLGKFIAAVTVGSLIGAIIALYLGSSWNDADHRYARGEA